MSLPALAVEPELPRAAFERQCAYQAARYAEGRVSLHRAVDALEAMAPLDLDVDQAQTVIAAAIIEAESADDCDDYEGLTHSFARLCRAEDAKQETKRQRRKPTPEQWRLGASVSTLRAARWLVKQNDPTKLQQWLAGRDARERLSICQYLEKARWRP